jgi:hypothetical protein
MGQARERDDIVAEEIAHDPNAPMFLISTRTEAQVTFRFKAALWGLGLLGLALAVGGFWLSGVITRGGPAGRVSVYLAAGFTYLLAWALGWVWMVYNSMVELRQRVRQAWANVDVQLKRRNDLIPNLVRAVEGIRDHERNLQTELAHLRAQLAATPPGQPGPDHHACSALLAAVIERYPELKANESFMNLQRNLVDTEQRIALARGYFNDIATFYNTRLQIVPDRFVTALGQMKPQALMTASDFERAPVSVSFPA